MNALIISDSHGYPDRIERAIKAQKKILKRGEILTLFFLGDGLRDIYSSLENEDTVIYSVKGNCDFGFLCDPQGEEIPPSRLVNFGSLRIFMTHGHLFDVKSTLCRAEAEAIKQGADILLFGHTHNRTELYIPQGTLPCQDKRLAVFNPGSLGLPNFGAPSFGTLTIKDGGFVLSHGDLAY